MKFKNKGIATLGALLITYTLFPNNITAQSQTTQAQNSILTENPENYIPKPIPLEKKEIIFEIDRYLELANAEQLSKLKMYLNFFAVTPEYKLKKFNSLIKNADIEPGYCINSSGFLNIPKIVGYTTSPEKTNPPKEKITSQINDILVAASIDDLYSFSALLGLFGGVEGLANETLEVLIGPTKCDPETDNISTRAPKLITELKRKGPEY